MVNPGATGKAPIIVVGCGDMGLPMARQLVLAGFDVAGFDLRPANEFGDFESRMLPELKVDNPATVLLVVVRDAQQIRDVCFEQQALYSHDSYPRTLVISSTVSPRVITELRERLPVDVELIDAPMSGAIFSAEAGTLTFMLGGAKPEIDKLMPAFAAMGEKLHYMGESGQGMLTKVLNNYVAACTVVGVRRVLARASYAGLDTDALMQVLNSSSGETWFGRNLDRLYWAMAKWEPTNTMGILEKDVRAALDVEGIEPDEFDRNLVEALRNLK